MTVQGGDPEPDLFSKYGRQILGPWAYQSAEVQDAWRVLQNRVAWRRRTAGRPLGSASGGDRGFWDQLGVDEGELPVHLPMGVTEDGQGPAGDEEAHHWVCWCGDVECPLTLALSHAWRSGRSSA